MKANDVLAATVNSYQKELLRLRLWRRAMHRTKKGRFLAIPLILFFLLLIPAYGQNHSATLTWAWSQGTGDPATGFHVQRSTTTGGPYTTIATVSSPTTLTYKDTTVAAGQTYYYVITAFNAGGDSTPSNQVTCVVPFSPPTAPTGLSGTVN